MRKIIYHLLAIGLCISSLKINAQSVCLSNYTSNAKNYETYYTGGAPYQSVKYDFNSDGNLDLAIGTSDGVSILLGKITGGFAAPQKYLSDYFTDITASDFNKDGKMDLAVLGNSKLRVLLGDGQGGFSLSAFSSSSAGTGTALTSGDYNNDGNPDVVIAPWSYTNYVKMCYGDGMGGFSSFANIPAGNEPFYIINADVNNDGRIDLVTANAKDNTISILIANSSGSFNNPVNYASAGTYFVEAADFNADNNLDLVLDIGGGRVGVLLGNGAGAFGTVKISSIGVVYKNMSAGFLTYASGEFNGDSKTDLIVTERVNSVASFLAGKGDGTFEDGTSFPAGQEPTCPLSGDFNKDGKLDVVISNTSNSNISILEGYGDGTFGSSGFYFAGTKSEAIYSGDFNGDSFADIAIADTSSDKVYIQLNDGTGVFAASANYEIGKDPNSISAADFNKDGKLDLATANGKDNSISILLNSGSGLFQSAVNYSVGSGATAISTGDFNKDDNIDIVVNMKDKNVAVLINKGDGTFSVPTNFDSGANSSSLAIVDLNNDGNLDLAITSTSSYYLNILMGNGNGSFDTKQNYWIAYTSRINYADYNGDGNMDLAYNSGNGSVYVHRGNGSGVFNNSFDIYGLISQANDIYVKDIVSVDFNNDGKIDIGAMITNTNASSIYVFINHGNDQSGKVIFADPVVFTFPFAAYFLTSADYDGDGFSDIAVSHNHAFSTLFSFSPTLNTGLTEICSNASVINLTGGLPLGGYYSGDGVSNGSFDPTALTAIYDTIIYNVQNSYGCVASAVNRVKINSCETNGVSEKEENSLVELYPNPATDLLNIKTQNALHIEGVKVFNEMGVLVKESLGTDLLDLIKLPTGLYLIHIKYEGKVISKKIVKR